MPKHNDLCGSSNSIYKAEFYKKWQDPGRLLCLLLVRAGVEQNPGPKATRQIWLCSVCGLRIRGNVTSVLCTRCGGWCHMRKCSGLANHRQWASDFVAPCCFNQLACAQSSSILPDCLARSSVIVVTEADNNIADNDSMLRTEKSSLATVNPPNDTTTSPQQKTENHAEDEVLKKNAETQTKEEEKAAQQTVDSSTATMDADFDTMISPQQKIGAENEAEDGIMKTAETQTTEEVKETVDSSTATVDPDYDTTAPEK